MRICLDSNCVIYFVEKSPIWGSKVAARLLSATAARDTIAVCDLARAECLIGPIRTGDVALTADYNRFFSSPAVLMLPVTAAVCERVARIRAAAGQSVKLPDAIHLAAAIEHRCDRFLTNDSRLARCAAIAVEVLT